MVCSYWRGVSGWLTPLGLLLQDSGCAKPTTAWKKQRTHNHNHANQTQQASKKPTTTQQALRTHPLGL